MLVDIVQRKLQDKGFCKYGMPYESPLYRLLTRNTAVGRGNKVPPISIPEYIKLRDGRSFAVRELLNYCTRPVAVIVGKKPPKRAASYTDEERVWISDATLEAVMTRYRIDSASARRLISSTRFQIKMAEENRKKYGLDD